MTCQRCNWNYPAEFVLPFRGTAFYYEACCGICALELKNQIHGTQDTVLTGSMAEKMRRYAIEWRKKNPELGPKAVA